MSGGDHGELRATAGIVLRDDQGRILLMRRATENTWGIPGGGVESGESWAAAALRECREETGWNARIQGLLGVYSDPATQTHTYPNGSIRQFVGVVFLGAPLEQTGSPDGEATAWRWFAADELPEPLFGPDVPVLRDLFDPVAATPIIG